MARIQIKLIFLNSRGVQGDPEMTRAPIQLSLRDDIRANSGAVELLIRRMYTSSVVSPFDAQGTVNVDAANNCCGTGFSDLL